MAKRVLILDPDESIVVSLEFLLHRAGYTVLVADAASSLLDQIVNEAPDVVVLADEQRQGADGFELCRAVCAERPAPPVLMLASRARDADAAKARAVGAADFLAKPFPTRDFLERIARLASEVV
ncbi:response regulator [Niveibacterium umoris]|uniref:DNA-binding response OmpR family regulator n=1 Tax=Niveibacterium umoris TaxID=1193620 RepID=A0A840BGW2_9RHOO|nr:response regulator [Niveibacterium umoris]MBB4010842.1 DNA-binding response OmpR family regulator [Niveibacterium umoris]